MKKITALLVVTMVLVMILSACGTKATEPAQAPAEGAPAGETQAGAGVCADKATLKILAHQNPPMVEFMTKFNQDFMAKYPNVTVDMSVVNANDLSTVTQTRLTANDVDIIDIFGFANAAEPYMKNVTAPNWQTLIDAGLLADLSGEAFVKNYDPDSTKDACTYKDKAYCVNLGRVSYSGIYYNKDLFEANNVKVPTTWSELVAACETFNAAGIPCMTAGGKDGWPIFVGAYGLIGSVYPDQAALVEGLWNGSVKWNDAKSLEMWEKMKVYAQDMMEAGASGIAGDAAPGRFASGAVAMFPGGTWYGSAIEAAQPGFEWGYIPFPGSDNPDDNKYLFGKYDQGWAVAEKSPLKACAMLYLSEFSDPANYQAFANAVGFIPTQPGATLNTKIGAAVAPFLENFRVGFEQYWIAPKGAGQYALPYATFFKPFGTFEDTQELANKVQEDLQSGLDANQ